MYLTDLRNQIDEIDNELVGLFVRRMEIAAKVAEYKRINNLPIKVPVREQEILQKVSDLVGEEMEGYVRELYTKMFELSSAYQCMKNTDT